jgi:hypothetical protein
MLEGYTVIVDRWPTPEEEIILFYDPDENRDIEQLIKKWQ